MVSSTSSDAHDAGHKSLWRLPLEALGLTFSEASEVAMLLEETTMGEIRVDSQYDLRELVNATADATARTPRTGRAPSLKDRIKSAKPIGTMVDTHQAAHDGDGVKHSRVCACTSDVPHAPCTHSWPCTLHHHGAMLLPRMVLYPHVRVDVPGMY